LLLVTGATGAIGRALVTRLVAHDASVRCLVRDARALGDLRVRVQLALGDLAEPRLPRGALRGVDTVVHLACARRDQREATIEEVIVGGTARLVAAARAAGVERFVYRSWLGAEPWAPARVLRAHAAAERIVRSSGLDATIVRPSLVIARDDRLGAMLRWCVDELGFVPLPGRGGAPCRPIWSDDVAACLARIALASGASATAPAGEGEPSERRTPTDRPRTDGRDRAEVLELCGPELLTQRQLLAAILRAQGVRRPVVPLPWSLVRRAGALVEALGGGEAPTLAELELLRSPSVCARGDVAVRALGVEPVPVALALS